VVDETGFLKQGKKSVGAQRQYSGTTGKIENCQIGVFLVYASQQGHAFLDRELCLPKEWAEAEERRREAGVPEGATFRTKGQLAREMISRVLTGGVPCAWVTGDEVYGGDRRLRFWLEQQEVPHVLAVKSTDRQLAAQLPQAAWQRLSKGTGCWCAVALTMLMTWRTMCASEAWR
jgi:SRSO17 transposase